MYEELEKFAETQKVISFEFRGQTIYNPFYDPKGIFPLSITGCLQQYGDKFNDWCKRARKYLNNA